MKKASWMSREEIHASLYSARLKIMCRYACGLMSTRSKKIITSSCSTYLSATFLQYSHLVSRVSSPRTRWLTLLTGWPHSTQIIPAHRRRSGNAPHQKLASQAFLPSRATPDRASTRPCERASPLCHALSCQPRGGLLLRGGPAGKRQSAGGPDMCSQGGRVRQHLFLLLWQHSLVPIGIRSRGISSGARVSANFCRSSWLKPAISAAKNLFSRPAQYYLVGSTIVLDGNTQPRRARTASSSSSLLCFRLQSRTRGGRRCADRCSATPACAPRHSSVVHCGRPHSSCAVLFLGLPFGESVWRCASLTGLEARAGARSKTESVDEARC